MSSPPTIRRIELGPAHVPFRAAVREAMAKSEDGLGMEETAYGVYEQTTRRRG